MRRLWKKYQWLGLVLAVALVLRLPHLTGSFWLDEAAQALEADRPWSQQFQIRDDFQPPLLHLLTFGAIQLGRSEWWLRTVGALLPGLLTIAGTYALGVKFANRRAALAAALLLATSSFHIFFSQELRPYSLSALWAVWSWFFLWESERVGRDTYQLPRGNRLDKLLRWLPVSRDFFFFLGCSILGLYTSYLYPFVLATQLLYLAARRRWRPFWYALLIPSVAFLPWLPSFIGQLQAGQSLRQTFPGWEQIVSFSLWKAPALTVGKFLYGVVDLEINWFYGVASALGLGLLIAMLAGHDHNFYAGHRDKIYLWLHVVATPLVLASLVSIWVPVIQPKRVIFLLPFVYVGLAYLIFAERYRVSRAGWTLFIWLLTFNLLGTGQYYFDPRVQRENWRDALQVLHDHYNGEEAVAIFAYPEPFSPWIWYEKGHAETAFPYVTTGAYDTGRVADLVERLRTAESYEVAIVPDYLRSLTDSRDLIPQFLTGTGWQAGEILDYPNLGQIHVYHRESQL